MQTLHLPFDFQPEQAAQLRQAYTQLSNALETGSSFDAAQLRVTLTAALEAQPALGSGAFQRMHDERPVQRLLHLSFAEDGSNLLDLPWHLAAEGSPHLLVSKGLPNSGDLPGFKPDLPKPLKVLVMIAAPEDGGARLSYEAEEKIILDALSPLLRTGEVEVEFTDDGSLESLRQSLANNRFHVLHFSGHGIFSSKNHGEAPEATLLLEDEFSMAARPTSAADFAAVLSADPDRMPALVLLSSCQTGMGGKDGGFRGAAQRLLQAGVPAVIAMGWSVADFWATHFAKVFYEKIARRATLAEAFNQSLAAGRKVQRDWLPEQLSHAPQDALQALFTAQSLIPQLFLTRQVVKLVDWGAAADKRLSRAGVALLEGKNRLGDKLKKIHAVFGGRDEWLFIGRRRERKAALAALRDGRSVLLRGQGGMGKTALALHLAQRRLAADPDNCVPFAFDQTSLSLENICNALLDFLETDCRLRTMRTHSAAVEKLWDRFFLLLENVEKQGVTPLFLLDNLETFQTEEGGELKPEALELLDYLITRLGYPVICTGRYPLREYGAEVLHPVEMNLVPFGDFRQKCLHLPALRHLDVPGRSFDDILQTLHQSLGGNYRSLEDFDELCRNELSEAPATLQALDDLISRYAGEALQNRAKDLVFGKLLALLTTAETTALALLAQFNRPVLPFALEWQPLSPGEAEPLCARLADLTLAERRTGEAEGRTYFFVPPLVRELLGKGLLNLRGLVNLPPDLALDDERAGAYFEKAQEMNRMNPSDLEEAFFHYERAGKVEMVNDIGNRLSRFYSGISQFQISFGFARRTEALAGEQTLGGVLNKLGQLYQVQGKLGDALHYFERAKADALHRDEKKDLGMLLNNISQIHMAKGDYDTALGYLQKSLKIVHEIGDRHGESTTIGNIASIYHAKGEYDNALEYFDKDLKICQEIGDRWGEGVTLNNISQIHMAKGDYDTALGYLQQSLKIQQEIGDRQGEGATLGNISKIHYAKGDYDTALRYLQKSLKICQEIGDRKGEGVTLSNISQIYSARGDYDRALGYLQQSLKIQQEIGDRQGEGTTLNNISQIYDVKGDYDRALGYLQQSLKIRQEIGDRQGEGVTLNNISQIYSAKGDYDRALGYLQQSLKIRQEIGARAGMCPTLHNMAFIYLQQKGDVEKFFEHEQAALQIALEIGNTQGIYEIGRALGQFLCENGATEQGLPILALALQAGQHAGFPGAAQVAAAIQHFSNKT